MRPARQIDKIDIAGHAAAQRSHGIEGVRARQPHVGERGADFVGGFCHLARPDWNRQYGRVERASQWILPSTGSPLPTGPFVYARDYAAMAGRLPVVCLHGLTRNSADFEAVAPKIAALGRRVIAIDARGRGRSDNDPDATRYRPDVYVGDVLHVLDTLGIPRAVFLGTSMGGIMTMLAATIAPDRIAAAILNDIGAEVDPAGLKRIASYVGKAGPFASGMR